jgi:2-hydroxychromene-2-carboxylate isomerase
MTKAKWYFDFLSPFAYLQLARFQKLPPDIEITTVPVVLGAILKHWGQLGPAEIPPKTTFCLSVLSMECGPAGHSICNAPNASV